MLRLRKLALLLMVAVAAAIVGFSVPNAYANPHAKPAIAKEPRVLEYGGVMMGDYEFYTQDKADAMMQRVRDSGLNTVRLYIRWDWVPSPRWYDLQAVCYAAKAAEKVGLKALILSLAPAASVWPMTQDDLAWFVHGYVDGQEVGNIAAYDRLLFDPETGCLSHLSPVQVMWAPGNEPNIDPTFCDGADKDPTTRPAGLLAQRQECAKRETLLLHASYTFIQTEEHKYGVSLPVIGGLLSATGAPIDFMALWAQSRQALGYKGCDMDFFGFHPYAASLNNPYTGLNMVPKIIATLKAWRCPVPVIFTEMGYHTSPPIDPGGDYFSTLARLRYTDIPATPERTLSGSEYVTVVSNAMKMTLNFPSVIGALNMLLDDEQRVTNGWQSGWYYWDGTPKPFLDQVRQIFQNALNPKPAASPPARDDQRRKQ